MAQHSPRIYRLQGDVLEYTTLASGAFLLSMLPAGIWLGTDSILFSALFFVHLFFLVGALAASLRAGLLALSPRSIWLWVALAAFTLWLLAWIPLATLPPTARDALIHHLAVPKWWLAAGRIVEFPWHEWSYYPMLLQLGFTALLRFGLEDYCALYHGTFLIILAGVAAKVCSRLSGAALVSPAVSPSMPSITGNTDDTTAPAPIYGCAAFIFTLYLPINFTLAISPLVDLGLALFCLLACGFFLRWLESPRSVFLGLCGLSLGLALGSKFNALLFIVCFLAAVLLICAAKRLPLLTSARALLLPLAIAVLVYSPWMLKSYAWTGNPIFPLYKSWFAASPSERLPGPGGLNPLQTRLIQYQESWGEVLALPLRIFIEGRDNDPRLFDGRLSPLLLLAFLPMLGNWRDRNLRFLLVLNCFYILAALMLSGARIRYFSPVLGSMVVSACCALGAVRMRLGRLFGTLLVAALCTLHMLNGITHLTEYAFDPIARAYLRGAAAREQFLDLRVPEFRMIRHINKTIAPESRVYLVLTSNSFYYYSPAVYSAGHHSGRELIGWIKKASTPEGLLRRFNNKGITHLLLHGARTSRLLGSSLSSAETALWLSFGERYLRPLRMERGLLFYEVNDEALHT